MKTVPQPLLSPASTVSKSPLAVPGSVDDMSSFYARMGVASPIFDPALGFVTSPVFRPSVLAGVRLTFALYSLVTIIVDLALQAKQHTDGR